METDLKGALLSAMGHPTRVREVTLIPRHAWDSTVVGIQVPQAELSGGHRALTPVEMARIESLRRVCNLKVGRPADDSHQARPAAASSGEPALAGGQNQPSGTETSGARASTPRQPSKAADRPKAKKKTRPSWGQMAFSHSTVRAWRCAASLTRAGAAPIELRANARAAALISVTYAWAH